MKIFGLAFKNLFRYGRRTIITMVALAVGILLFIFIDSMLAGVGKDSERNIKWYETGSGRFLHSDYWDKREEDPLDLAIQNPETVGAFLEEKNIPYTFRTTFLADMIVLDEDYLEKGSLNIQITAIDPARDNEVFNLKEFVIKGEYPDQNHEGVILGSWLSEDMDIPLGNELTLVTRTKDGFYQSIDTVVTGILETPNPSINRHAVFMPLGMAEEYLEMDSSVTQVVFRIPEVMNEEKTLAALRNESSEIFSDLNITLMSWDEIAYDFIALNNSKQAGTKFVLFFVFIIAAVGISNTMLMAVMERTHEMGMMQAMGMTLREIKRMFHFEAAMIGFFGALSGVILAIPAVALLVANGIDYSSIMRTGDMGYRITGIMYGSWEPVSFILALLMGTLLAYIVAAISTRRILKKSITDCLRQS